MDKIFVRAGVTAGFTPDFYPKIAVYFGGQLFQ
jgi:hypothetical protein